jgi:hypothetical protein
MIRVDCEYLNGKLLRHCATRRKVAGLRLDGVNELSSICLILSVTLGPGVLSASNRNEYQKQKNRARPVRKADNLTAICEPIV